MNISERSFLQELREAANKLGNGNFPEDWSRAYLALGDAADRLDAMQARIETASALAGDVPPIYEGDARISA